MTAMVADLTGAWEDTNVVTTPWASLTGSGAGGVAGETDTLTIDTAVVLTVTTGTTQTIGNLPNDVVTYEVTLNGTGQLVVGGTLNVKTNVNIEAGGVITVNGGGVLNIDSSHRAGTKEHRLRLGNTGSGKLVLNDDATITSPSGSAWYQLCTGLLTNAGQLDINGTASAYALVQRMQRSGSNDGWAIPVSGTGVSASGKFEASHCIFDECDDLVPYGSGTWTSTFEFCKWQNSTGTRNLQLSSFATSVTKLVNNCTFDKNTGTSGAWSTAASITPQDCIFYASWTLSGTGGTPSGIWNLKRMSGQAGCQVFQPASGGTIVSHELLWKDFTGSNPHFNSQPGLTGSRTWDGSWTLVLSGSSTEGDGWLPSNLDSNVLTARNVLLVPGNTGAEPGTWLSQAGGPSYGYGLHFEHWTGPVGPDSQTKGISVGETDPTPASRVLGIKSCIAYEAGTWALSTTGFLTEMQPAQTINDPYDATGIDHNCVYAVNVSSPSHAYCSTAHAPATATQTVPTAANDIYGVDPELLDSSRSIEEWAAWWGNRVGASGDGTTTPNADATTVNARLLVLAMHDGTFDEVHTSTGIQQCIKWIQRGHLSTSLTLRGAGHDGLTPGIFGGWLPTLSSASVTGTTGSVTSNIADGTLYWVVTQSATTPDWDRTIAGEDDTGSAVGASFQGSQTVTASGVQSIDLSGVPVDTGYYLHCVLRGEGSEAGLDDYLRTSETVSSASFDISTGEGGRIVHALVSNIVRNIKR